MGIAGSHIGWTSPSLPYLKSEISHLPMSNDDSSWIASFFLLGSVPGNLLAAFIVDTIGRKLSLLLAGVPLTLGWLLIIFARNAYYLYASRFISGFGMGIVYVVCPMYIGEIADKKIRGALGTFIKLMVTFGELYSHAVGPFTKFHELTYACLLIPVVFFMTFIWMPESPYYLMTKAVLMDMKSRAGFRDLFMTEGNRKGLTICFGLQLILQFSGIAAIESYTQEIVAPSESGLTPGISVIILSVCQLVAGLGAAVLVDKLGRRPLLMSTTLCAAVVLMVSSAFSILKIELGWPLKGLGWILDSSVILYEFIIALGLNPLPYMMLGELFPTNVKGVAVSIANVWGSILAFFVAKMFQVVTDTCGMYASFAWFAASCVLGLVFIQWFVPETKGKSLGEIQDELNCRKKVKTINQEVYIKTIDF
ncbi:Similar to Tret1: Facilitated trehalose transporter Tret1 (Bombyx mori) [Cotesia congregata]|uniref:Similar to Tret1: Facilitated trehalose transporter Tret1 (Bombyx mori) n=1 Tax=Cotesia congregata TaxID=51543 RepID=A0A8J2H3Z2_COTCN|nr:Similar to Tret1: Facilitated trehalose transporter Tret1 (Bombyx mori) [Cotesia congregata]